jgi:hypothetical protein
VEKLVAEDVALLGFVEDGVAFEAGQDFFPKLCRQLRAARAQEELARGKEATAPRTRAKQGAGCSARAKKSAGRRRTAAEARWSRPYAEGVRGVSPRHPVAYREQVRPSTCAILPDGHRGVSPRRPLQ